MSGAVARGRGGYGMLVRLLVLIGCLGPLLGDRATAAQEGGRFFELSVPLKVNARYVGDLSVRVTAEGESMVETERFIGLLAPLLGPAAMESLVLAAGEDDFVATARLGTGPVVVGFDPALLELSVTLPVTALGTNDLPVARRAAPDPGDFDPPEAFALGLGATVAQSYAFQSPSREGRGPLRAAARGYASLGGFGGATLFFGAEFEENAPRQLRREEVLFVADDYAKALRVSAGDLFAPIAALQTAPPLLGVSVAREYQTIRPFTNIRSSGRGALTLERDATVEVYVNGLLSETLRLASGQYQLTDFPLAAGSNDVRFVVEDALGRTELSRLSIYSEASLLGPGVLDFAGSAGVRRRRAPGGFDYGDDPLVTGFVNYGVADRLNLGANLQADGDVLQAGLTAGLGTPLGVSVLNAAYSDAADVGSGYAFAVDHVASFTLGAVPTTFNLSLTYEDEDFASLSAIGGRRALTTQALLRTQLPRGLSFSLTGNTASFHDAVPSEHRIGVSLGRTFRRAALSLNGTYASSGGKEDLSVLLGVSWRLGRRHALRARYGSQGSLREVEAVRTRTRQLGDLAGRVRASRSDAADRLTGSATYFHNRFEAELDFTHLDRTAQAASTSGRLRASSFVGFADGTLAIGRNAPEGFVIVRRHSSLSQSSVTVRDESGRRDLAAVGPLGPALVPVERAYLPRRFGLSVDPLPMGYDLGSSDVQVLPGLGSAYVVEVGSDASRTVLGRLRAANGEPVALAVGRFERTDGDESLSRDFFTNGAGRFVVERVAAGRYVLVVGAERSAPIEVGEDTEGLVDVGIIALP